jgi:hypothetical protein
MLLGGLATLSAGTLCAAQESQMPPGVQRPLASGRLVASFGFEEQATNPTDVPQYWHRPRAARGNAAAERFPSWNEARLSYTTEGGLARTGTGSVVLPTRGGNTAMTLSPGVIPVFSDADYRVTCHVMTRHMQHAAAFLVARLLDQKGRLIDGAEFRSQPVRSQGAWTLVSVGVPGGIPAAAYLQIELLVLQPHDYAAASLGSHQIWVEDFDASAYFDDIEVNQPPRVELSTHTASNILGAGQTPEILATVRDLTGESLTTRLRVLDEQGREIDQGTLEVGNGIDAAPWRPRLTRFGWYRCVLDVYSGVNRVGGSYLDFAYVADVPEGLPRMDDPDDPATQLFRADRNGFGIAVLDSTADSLGLLGSLAAHLDARHYSIPVMTTALTQASLSAHTTSLMRSIDVLLADARRITLCLGPVPDQLAATLHLAPSDAWTLAQQDRGVWTPYVTALMDRYGQRINHWQVGRFTDAFGANASPSLMGEALKVQKELSTLVAGARVLIPVEAAASLLPGPTPATVGTTITADPMTTADQVTTFLKTLEGASVGEMPDALVMPSLPLEDYGRVAAASECAKRLVRFWEAGKGSGFGADQMRFDIEQPWTIDRLRIPRVSPTVEVPVWINTVNRLAGRRIVGSFPAPDGVVCLILVPASDVLASRGGALVMWNQSAPDAEAVLQSPLGQGDIRIVDLFGNSSPAPRSRGSLGGEEIRVTAGRAPIFIEGIDVQLAKFLAGFKLSPTLLESNNSRHDLELVMENPWPTGISGTVTILRPGGPDTATRDRGWRVSPRTFGISLGAAESTRVPFTVSFSPAEEMGPKQFVMEVRLSADKQYRPFEITRVLNVGMADMSLDLSYIARGEDLIVEAAVSNRGAENRTLAMTAYAPDQPRSKASISELAGGTQTIRRFSYKGALRQLAGKRIVVTVGDPGNDSQLTRSVVISVP